MGGDSVRPILEASAVVLEQTIEVLAQAPAGTHSGREPNMEAKRAELMRGVAKVWISFVPWSRQCQRRAPHFTNARGDHFIVHTHDAIDSQSIAYLEQGATKLRGESPEPLPPCARLLWEAKHQPELFTLALNLNAPPPGGRF